jgi:dihydropteroate synthase
MHWQTTRFDIDLTTPKVMGIVNVTPDSFSDGGLYATTSTALQLCERLLKEGAHMLDIGGESTRPGSPAVSLADELDRVLPVVQAAVQLGVPISVDTYKPEVMRAVLDAGADVINDVWALRRSGALQAVAEHARCGVCLMHMHRDPQTMQVAPMAGDVVAPVLEFLRDRADALLELGVDRQRIVLDPGVGFGKTVEQNFSLLAQQQSLLTMGFPVLGAWSRKSSLGAVTNRERPADRVAASVAAALMAVERGARIVRVHDVAQTVDALKVWQAVEGATMPPP